MANETPIGMFVGFIALGIVMIYFFPLVFNVFTTPEEFDNSPLLDEVLDLLDTEVTIFGFDFYLVPAFLQGIIEDFLLAWSQVPTVITLILLIPSLFGMLYSLIMIVKDMIPFT